MNKLSAGPGTHNHGRTIFVSGTLSVFVRNFIEKFGGIVTSVLFTFSNTIAFKLKITVSNRVNYRLVNSHQTDKKSAIVEELISIFDELFFGLESDESIDFEAGECVPKRAKDIAQKRPILA